MTEPETSRRMKRVIPKLHGILTAYEEKHGAELADRDALLAELMDVMRPHAEDATSLWDTVAELHRQLAQAKAEVNVAFRNGDLYRAEGTEKAARLQRQIAADRVQVLKAELLQAEIDAELAKAGYEYPQGSRGVKDALGHLKMYDAQQKAYHDFLQRIADVVAPEEGVLRVGRMIDPGLAKDAYNKVAEIVEEFEEYERER